MGAALPRGNDQTVKPGTPEQVSVEFAKAISAGDLDGAAGLFAEDACFLAADGQRIHGRAAIRGVLEQLLVSRPAMEVEIEEMIAVGAIAIGSERWKMKLQGPDGNPVRQSSRSTVVFRRSEQEWELLIDAPWGLVPGGHLQGTEDLAATAGEALRERRRSLEETLTDKGLSRAGGLFAIYASSAGWRQLGLGEAPDERPLYIGMARGKSTSRGLRGHLKRPFAAGRSSDSSLRRTFAALLADDLDLVAMPRRRPAYQGVQKWTHCALKEDGERRLSDWMQANLELAIWVSAEDAPLSEIRAALLREWLPPLHLLDTTTPWTAYVKAARTALTEQAKQWTPSA
jgi:uncharacterized protein (TIGR02246 family)